MSDDTPYSPTRPTTTTGPTAVGTRPANTPPQQERRTWPQRLTIAALVVAGLGCFAAGSVLYAAQQVVEDRNVFVLDTAPDDLAGNGAGNQSAGGDGDPSGPPETFPQADPETKNFLITGADNNACIDPDSPYAGAFGDRGEGFGQRSDTIMLWRVNPAKSQVAVLSFPRDLWVNIAGRSNKNRINSAYTRDNPQRLIDTIYQNFLIRVDHFVQVDFCAFKVLVDAVDGVTVPFDFPVRDANTGLNVPEPGCYTFDGDHALAYVRSRKMQYLNDDGEWVTDGTSDLGRISRQQDFIRRTADSLLAAGAFNPSVIRALIQTSDDYVVVDSELSLNKQLEFAGVLRNVAPGDITSYQIEARATEIQGQAVLIPDTGGSNMQRIIALFRGEADLASTSEAIADTDDSSATTSGTDTSSETSTDSDSGTDTSVGNAADGTTAGSNDTTDETANDTTADTATDTTADATIAPPTTFDSPIDAVAETDPPGPSTTLPLVEAEVNGKGIFPDPNATCS